MHNFTSNKIQGTQTMK